VEVYRNGPCRVTARQSHVQGIGSGFITQTRARDTRSDPATRDFTGCTFEIPRFAPRFRIDLLIWLAQQLVVVSSGADAMRAALCRRPNHQHLLFFSDQDLLPPISVTDT
jgi:hypothetical protein